MSKSKTAQKDEKGSVQPQKQTKSSVTTQEQPNNSKTQAPTRKRFNLACSKDPSHYSGTPLYFNPKWRCSKCGAPVIEIKDQSGVTKAPPTPSPVPTKVAQE